MSFLMALFTKCYTISDVKSKLWIFRERLDVVCVEFTTSFVAILTSIIISFKNFFTPQTIFDSASKNHIFSCFTTLPIKSFFAFKPFSFTSMRAKITFCKTTFFTIIRITTKFADFIFTFSKMLIVVRWFKFILFGYCATFSTTVKLFINERRVNIKLFFANWANLMNTFFSANIGTLSTTISGFVYIITRYIKTFMTDRANFVKTFSNRIHYYNFNIIEGVNQLRSKE